MLEIKEGVQPLDIAERYIASFHEDMDNLGNIAPDHEPRVSTTLDGIHEVAGVGMIFPNERGEPVLHMHAALGRGGVTRAGCVRAGIDVWMIGEAVIRELVDSTSLRRRDPATGFELLDIGEK